MNSSNFSNALLRCAQTHNPSPIKHLGQRYDAQGKFLPEPGNTVVCHLVDGSETQKVLADARERYQAMPDAEKLAFTPLSSLHMTLFQGIIEYRRLAPYWPEDVPLDTPIEQMTAIYLDRLKGFEGSKRFQVTVKEATPTGLIVVGVDARAAAIMQEWRDDLAGIFGYRHPDHDSYEFHITFAYLIERPGNETLPHWQQMLDEVTRDIQNRAPVLELRPPAFCSFQDMNHFEELQVFNWYNA